MTHITALLPQCKLNIACRGVTATGNSTMVILVVLNPDRVEGI